jgi:hypothetical protein
MKVVSGSGKWSVDEDQRQPDRPGRSPDGTGYELLSLGVFFPVQQMVHSVATWPVVASNF